MRLVNSILSLLFALIFQTISTAQLPKSLPLQKEKLAYAQEVEQEAISKNDTLLMAEAYYLNGKIHVAARDYLKSKDYFMKSLRIVEQKRKFDKVSRIYVQLSGMENDQHNWDKALNYARLSLAYSQNGPKRTQLAAYQIMATAFAAVYFHNPDSTQIRSLTDSIFYYCKQGERIALILKEPTALAGTYLTLGEFYQYQRNPKAFRYQQAALRLFKEMGHKLNQALQSQELARTHLLFNQPDQAYPLLQASEKIYNGLNFREFELEIKLARTYTLYYQQKKDWQNAFKYSELARNYEYDLLMADRDGAVSRLGVEYETEKREDQLKSQRRELALSQQNEQNQRRFLVVLIVLLLGTGVASVAFYRISNKNQRLSLHNAALVKEQNHRVKNNLQLISSLLSLQSNRLDDESARHAVEDSQRRIEVMSLLQRKLYDGDSMIAVNIDEFVRELTEMVLEAFELDRVHVSYQILPTVVLPADYAMRIGLILNELVTNACKYAFVDNPHPTLKIEATLDKKTFTMRVSDNGNGFDVAKEQTKSFGLRLIQMQVEQMYGTYKFDNEGGVIFEMIFNLLPTYNKWEK
ncbi:sensor histidine kinase [Spirosoma sp. BT702]|uniref:histidine kinase n=1 Tax=Spirosoma profusum TaxID=2771354 RepID=A0A927AWH2_9BACT|nr:sensor histidine kinase [Spirosoma profusum]MBD2705672.1 sensor histidine kinase [Spirosoma profusum]